MSFNSTREAADRQIRRSLVDFSSVWRRCRLRSHDDLTADFLPSERAPLPVLYDISAIGTKLCFYEFGKALSRVTPQRIPTDPDLESSGCEHRRHKSRRHANTFKLDDVCTIICSTWLYKFGCGDTPRLTTGCIMFLRRSDFDFRPFLS